MDAVLGVLNTIAGIFGRVSGALSSVNNILGNLSAYIFLGGFFGLLFAFLWFLFRYLDKKKLTLPALLFVLFLVIFLGGNLLLISNSTRMIEDFGGQTIETESAESSPSGDEINI